MRKLALTIATGALLASGVHADWKISSYPAPLTDSALVKATYGPTTFTNPASKVNLTVPVAEELAFTGTFASDGTAGYSANVGVIHPLNPSWEVGDLTGLTAIKFDIKLSAKPTEGVGVSISSKGYGKYNDEGKTHGYLIAPSALPAANVWKTITIPLEDLQPPGWWTPEPDFPDIADILKVVEAVQFSPKTLYSASGSQNGEACTKCVTPTTTGAVVMTLRNITLLGVEDVPLVNPTNIGCEGPSTVLDDFLDGDAQNLLGGYWYAYSDTSSDPAKLLDSARGNSTASFEAFGELDGAYASFGAGLNKNIAGSPFAWRPYAGWAAIGTGFEADGNLLSDMLTGIEFTLRATKLGTNVKGMNFKVTIPGVEDAKTHYVTIPTRQIDPASEVLSTTVCVRPEDLKQPSWVTDGVPFSPAKIAKLAWEAKIADQKSSTISSDSVSYLLSAVKLHGSAEFIVEPGVSVNRRLAKSSFRAVYANGALSFQGLSGYNTLSVVSPSGKVLSSFDAKLGSKQVKLDRGTYFLVARGDAGKTLSRKIVVLK